MTDGEVMLRNDILQLEQYVNGSVYLLRVQLEGETEFCGSIYPIATSNKSNGKIPLLENTHIPTDELLNQHLIDMTNSEDDLALIQSTSWQ